MRDEFYHVFQLQQFCYYITLKHSLTGQQRKSSTVHQPRLYVEEATG